MNKYDIIYQKAHNIKLVKMSYRNFMIYTSNWIYNRNINEERVNSIYENIKNNIEIGWILEGYEDKITNNIKILNGH
jgi:hypothetical protein